MIFNDFNYKVIFIFVVISGVLSGVLLLLSYFLSYRSLSLIEKSSSYECGFEPFGPGQSSFDIHFYIVGILFIIFDLEIVFLFPWALTTSLTGALGLFSIWFFLAILTIGFVFEWQKGALDWSQGYLVDSRFE